MLKYFHAISKQMVTQVREASQILRHSGMKGSLGEEVVRTFLQRYLPGQYRLGQGKIVDFNGNESKQVDIIVMDAVSAIPFYVDDTNMIVPIESVYATIEVKTSLTKQTMTDAIANISSVRKLSFAERYALVRGGAVVDLKNQEQYPRGFVLALNRETSSPIPSITQQYLSFVRQQSIHFSLISCCAILSGGCFVDIPELDHKTSEVFIQEVGEDTLMLFFLNLISAMSRMEKRSTPSFELYSNLGQKRTEFR